VTGRKFGYEWAARMSPEARAVVDEHAARGARLVETTDERWTHGRARIKKYAGWNIPDTDEKQVALQALYASIPSPQHSGASEGPPQATEAAIRIDRDAVQFSALRVANKFRDLLWSLDRDNPLPDILRYAENKRKVDGKIVVVGDPEYEREPFSPFKEMLPLPRVKPGLPAVDQVRVVPVFRYSEAEKRGLFDGWTYGAPRDQEGAAFIYLRINVANPQAFELRDDPESFVPLVASVLTHELTHIRDLLRHKHQVDPGQNLRGYYNSPAEVKAYMGQVVYEVVRAASMQEVRAKADVNRNPNDVLVEEALARSPAWQQIDKHLTPDNKAKVLRAAYRALSERNLLYSTGPRLPTTKRAAE
jgi:hypothetical protein